MRLEELYAWSILLKAEIANMEQYTAWLYDTFMKMNKGEPYFDLLVDLAFCTNDIRETLSIIRNYTFPRKPSFDFTFIGSILLKSLEEIYKSDTYDLYTLASQGYYIWTQLPECMEDEPPFSTLRYIDDFLEYGDEQTTRELFQSIFDYYKQ